MSEQPAVERPLGAWVAPLPDADVQRALVVMAHPDDADYGAAGTLGQWAAAGIEVSLLCVTRGDAGGFDDTERSRMPGIREAEQRAAAAGLGITDVRFLDGYPDGGLRATPALVRDIVAAIRQVRPQRVLTQSPERDYTRLQASHPDHLAAGEATVRAVYPAAENPFAWPELLRDGLAAWKVRELWLFAHPTWSHAVDVTDQFDRKLAALAAHASQTGHMGDELARMVRDWNSRNARLAELPDGRLAELFAVSRVN